MNLKNQSFRSGFITLLLTFFMANALFSQGRIAHETDANTLAFNTQQSQDWYNFQPFDVSQVAGDKFEKNVEKATWLRLDQAKLTSAMAKKPRYLQLTIPQADGGADLVLLLEKTSPVTAEFSVMTPQGKADYTPGLYYHGKIADKKGEKGGTMVAISLFDNEIIGILADEIHRNMVLGNYGSRQNGLTLDYVFYEEQDLKKANPFSCGVAHDEVSESYTENHSRMNTPHRLVREYIEVENTLFTNLGNSVTNSVNYVTALFNFTALIYDRENVMVLVNEVFVWTSVDSYPSMATDSTGACSAPITAFETAMTGGFNGDLAHLFSADDLGGGCGNLAALCLPLVGERTAVSGNLGTSFSFFPTFSWEVYCVTHELGHNLGSPHTQWCGWPSGALDNCFATEGGCAQGPAPVNGGTMMSYCHLNSTTINFNHGFGFYPGNAVRAHVESNICTPISYLDCAGATEIFTPYFGTLHDNTGAANNANNYNSCVSWNESGPENVFRLVLQTPSSISVNINSGSGLDHDVFLLESCTEFGPSCLAFGDVSFITGVLPAGEYFIVVDGYNGSQGAYALYVNTDGYCYANGNTDYEWINSVHLGGLNETTGNNRGYQNNAQANWVDAYFQAGENYFVDLIPGYTGASFNENWKIYMDLNKDEDFSDPYELVFDASGIGTVSGSFTPTSLETGVFSRMRITMNDANFPNEPCGFGNYGEKEDYLVFYDQYCASQSYNYFEWITGVQIGSFTHNSGVDFNGYKFFNGANEKIIFKNGETVPVTLTQAYDLQIDPVKWRIFADLNLDNDFDDAGEELLDTPFSTAPFSGNMTISTNFSGWTRLRIQMDRNQTPGACQLYGYGETQDYWAFFDEYCAVTALNNQEAISAVQINENSFYGGYFTGTSYTLYEGNTYSVTKGTPTSVSVTPLSFIGNNPVGWVIWVDLNHDNLFAVSEEVWSSPNISSDVQTGTFTVGNWVTAGYTRMRIQMYYNAHGLNPCEVGFRGEYIDVDVFVDDYCQSYGAGNEEHFSQVEFVGSMLNFTGFEGLNYNNYLPLQANLVMEQSSQFNLTVAYDYWFNTPQNDYAAIYIDYNHDHDFDEPNELAFITAQTFQYSISDYITPPNTAMEGLTRMRIILSRDPITSACGTFTNGETEDYNVFVACANAVTYYADLDFDGYGDPLNTFAACTQPMGYISDNTDCDDQNYSVNPSGTEFYNSIDDNCNGTVDELSNNEWTTALPIYPRNYVFTPADCSNTFWATTYGATYTVNPADNSVPHPQCAVYNNPVTNMEDVWFKFVPAAATSTSYVFRYKNLSATSGVVKPLALAIYRRNANNPAKLVALNSFCDKNFGSATTAMGELGFGGFVPGTEYFIRVWMDGVNNSGLFEFYVTTPPQNDDCTTAIPVYNLCTTNSNLVGTTRATRSDLNNAAADCPGTSAQNTGYRRNSRNDDVWFSFISPNTDMTVYYDNLTATLGGAGAMGFDVFDNCALDNRVCSGYVTGGCHTISGLTPGQNYYLRTYLFGNNNSGMFNLTMTPGVCRPDANRTQVVENEEIATDERKSQNEEMLHLTLYPNPASDVLQIKISGVDTENSSQFVVKSSQLTVTDLMGKVISQTKWKNGETVPETQILDVSQLPNGSYQVHFAADGAVRLTQKFVVLR